MATDPPIYDLVVLLDPSADEERRLKIMGDLEVLIDQHGNIVSRHEWGVRKTAFEIRKSAEADYHLIQFNGSNELLEALDHALKITDGVLRHRIIKVKPGTPEPPTPRPDAGRKREEGRPEGAAPVAARAAADAPARG